MPYHISDNGQVVPTLLGGVLRLTLLGGVLLLTLLGGVLILVRVLQPDQFKSVVVVGSEQRNVLSLCKRFSLLHYDSSL